MQLETFHNLRALIFDNLETNLTFLINFNNTERKVKTVSFAKFTNSTNYRLIRSILQGDLVSFSVGEIGLSNERNNYQDDGTSTNHT